MPQNDVFASVLHPETGRPEAGTALGSHMWAWLGDLHSLLVLIPTFLLILHIYFLNFILANIASFSSKPPLKKRTLSEAFYMIKNPKHPTISVSHVIRENIGLIYVV